MSIGSGEAPCSTDFADSQRPRVLAVDDDPIVLQLVHEILHPEFDVETVCSAKEALDLIDGGASYSVVLCDLTMPEMSGLELLRCVRERDSDLPVIVLTGDQDLSTAMKVMEHRGFRYLTKPVDHESMRDAVRSGSAAREVSVLRRQAFDLCESRGWNKRLAPQLDRHLTESMNKLFMVFQPIVEASNHRLFGYEALVRSDGRRLTSPGRLFDAAEELGRVHDLGRGVRTLVAQAMTEAPLGASIFVNLHPHDLQDDDLYLASAPLSQFAERVVLEITERMTLASVADLPERLQRLRNLGYRLAVDDLGAGYAGLSSFSELKPDIVKLDMSLIRDLDACRTKQSIVGSILDVCRRDLDTRVVCEGVETEAELKALRRLGADLLQGYLFAQPTRHFGEFSLPLGALASWSPPPAAE